MRLEMNSKNSGLKSCQGEANDFGELFERSEAALGKLIVESPRPGESLNGDRSSKSFAIDAIRQIDFAHRMRAVTMIKSQ